MKKLIAIATAILVFTPLAQAQNSGPHHGHQAQQTQHHHHQHKHHRHHHHRHHNSAR